MQSDIEPATTIPQVPALPHIALFPNTGPHRTSERPAASARAFRGNRRRPTSSAAPRTQPRVPYTTPSPRIRALVLTSCTLGTETNSATARNTSSNVVWLTADTANGPRRRNQAKASACDDSKLTETAAHEIEQVPSPRQVAPYEITIRGRRPPDRDSLSAWLPNRIDDGPIPPTLRVPPTVVSSTLVSTGGLNPSARAPRNTSRSTTPRLRARPTWIERPRRARGSGFACPAEFRRTGCAHRPNERLPWLETAIPRRDAYFSTAGHVRGAPWCNNRAREASHQAPIVPGSRVPGIEGLGHVAPDDSSQVSDKRAGHGTSLVSRGASHTSRSRNMLALSLNTMPHLVDVARSVHNRQELHLLIRPLALHTPVHADKQVNRAAPLTGHPGPAGPENLGLIHSLPPPRA